MIASLPSLLRDLSHLSWRTDKKTTRINNKETAALQKALRPSSREHCLTSQALASVYPKPVYNLVQSGLELLHRVAFNNVCGKSVPMVTDSVREVVSTQVAIVSLQFKFIAMVSSSTFTQLKHVSVVHVFKPTKHFEYLDQLTPQSPRLQSEEV